MSMAFLKRAVEPPAVTKSLAQIPLSIATTEVRAGGFLPPFPDG